MTGYERLARLLLPVGLVVALLWGLLWSWPGQQVGALSWGPVDATVVSVVLVFLISGFAIHGAEVERAGYTRAALSVVVANLLLAPALAAVALALLPISGGLAFGLAVIVSVPTTLSSASVLTQITGGDHVWGAALTVTCVVVGAFTAPVAVSLLLRTEAGVPVGPLLLRVVVMVLVPLGVGILFARVTGWDVNRFWRLIPSAGVILLTWITVSQSSESLRQTAGLRLAQMIALVVAGHIVLLMLAWLAARGFDRRQGLAVFFVSAQKTLPLGLTLIAAVAALVPELRPLAAEAVVVAVLWHFSQLLIDSSLAARLARTAV